MDQSCDNSLRETKRKMGRERSPLYCVYADIGVYKPFYTMNHKQCECGALKLINCSTKLLIQVFPQPSTVAESIKDLFFPKKELYHLQQAQKIDETLLDVAQEKNPMTIFTSLRKLSDHHQWEQTYREIEIDRREREREG